MDAVRLYSGNHSVEQAVTPMGNTPFTLINLPLFLASITAKNNIFLDFSDYN